MKQGREYTGVENALYDSASYDLVDEKETCTQIVGVHAKYFANKRLYRTSSHSQVEPSATLSVYVTG